jgi:hypothetical protein
MPVGCAPPEVGAACTAFADSSTAPRRGRALHSILKLKAKTRGRSLRWMSGRAFPQRRGLHGLLLSERNTRGRGAVHFYAWSNVVGSDLAPAVLASHGEVQGRTRYHHQRSAHRLGTAR